MQLNKLEVKYAEVIREFGWPICLRDVTEGTKKMAMSNKAIPTEPFIFYVFFFFLYSLYFSY